MLIFHEFECAEGHLQEDVVLDNSKSIPKTIACDQCAGRANKIVRNTNFLHTTHSGMKYGEFDPQFGTVVEDYSHRKKLMRQMGMIDANDSVRGVPADQIRVEDSLPEPSGNMDGVIVTDDLKELGIEDESMLMPVDPD